MSHAVLLRQPGPPENFSWEDVAVPLPGPGEAQLQQTAAGINFIDTQFRSGLYKVGDLPAILGREGAGTVVAVGDGVAEVKVGERAAYASQMGAYTEVRNVRADRLVVLPDSIADETAAAMMLKGLTAQYLVRQVRAPVAGDVVLVHAAAGGVGLIACQWATEVGATMIGTVGTDAKARLAKRYGCKHMIVTSRQDIAEQVMRITKGEGVDVVYDSIGKDCWEETLQSVKRLGLVVSFGSASGTPPPLDLARQGIEKSAFFTRATTANYMTSDAIRLASARALFRMIKKGAVKARIGQTYALKHAAKAHRDAEARRTTGSTLLIP